ncbi:hypothetical protein PIIN_08326 [Serendipita indica DSM 11827]|uniref:F-box domain-containing protein n=1 Tax=Serendipita indica (strain DSM 11827) TaxID=1109443 RepID=G4TST0_SERID|nr:hypothetical protein PIIN_08326 [Serendipita indica DSM 11827]
MPISLPSDVLGEVFAWYGLSEDLYHPLETLLLVSRSWHDTALLNRGIWARFNIEVGHLKSMDIWKTRLQRRLDRIGPTTLLDISIRNVCSIPNHPCASEYLNENVPKGNERSSAVILNACSVRYFMIEILKDFNGHKGSLAKRWRSLHLCFGNQEWIYKHAGWVDHLGFALDALFYPTPALETLTFGYLNPSGDSRRKNPFLPFSPNLRTCTLSNYPFSSYPDMSAAREVTIIRTVHQGRHTKHPMIPLGNAVEKLVLGLTANDGCTLPASLPRLRNVEIGRDGLWCNLDSVQAPLLSQVTLRIQGRRFLFTIFSRVSFLSTVTHLTILDEVSALTIDTHKFTLCLILQSILSLVHLEADKSALEGILGLVRDSRDGSMNPGGTIGKVDPTDCPFSCRRVCVSCVEKRGDAEISSDMDSWTAFFRILRTSTMYTQNPDIADMIEGLERPQ